MSQPPPDGMSHQAREARYDDVSSALTRLDDQQLGRLVAAAPRIGSGIGGTSALLSVGSVPVFVKQIPLTDLERHPGNLGSTANLFGLPTFFQYGVGSPGFGAWRELAANTMTTTWVLAGRTEAFPLMYHWRVLSDAPPAADEDTDIDRAVSYWGGSPAVRRRFEALAHASASLVLFLEYIPQTLRDWLTEQLTAGPDALTAACAMVEHRLRADVAFMNGNGLLHFDAHFRNILTDGRRLYLADLGLATSTEFDLSTQERDFAARNRTHDTGHTLMELVNWLVTNAANRGASGPAERNEYIRRCAHGHPPTDVPPLVAALISQYAPIATVMNDFYWNLFGVNRTTPYPEHEIAQAMALTPGIPPTATVPGGSTAPG